MTNDHSTFCKNSIFARKLKSLLRSTSGTEKRRTIPAEMPGRMSGFSRVGERHDRCGVALPRSYLSGAGQAPGVRVRLLCFPTRHQLFPNRRRPATVAGRSSFLSGSLALWINRVVRLLEVIRERFGIKMRIVVGVVAFHAGREDTIFQFLLIFAGSSFERVHRGANFLVTVVRNMQASWPMASLTSYVQ